ncbi:MAG: hydrolase family protein [Satyrvirus sp.]|uniref:Hydrolase family protein n=1 Tax=Satyrvirus sp. TaxID=2487771 RepID=A0A3G5AEK4_9VIRU|nr:MAG: hydrolase family protein [Satyrvirus sp.]
MGSLLSISSSFTVSIDDKIEDFIYMPPDTRGKIENFRELGTTRSKLIYHQTKDNKTICGVVIYPYYNNNPDKYIVFSHGNASDIYSMFYFMKDLSDKLGVGIIGYDYIGFGMSHDEKPSERGCYDSMEAIMDYILNELYIDKKNIYLLGQSLGTGIAIDYVFKHNWTNPIILVSPYKSICRVVADTSLVAPIDKFNTLKKLGSITCPVKIFHGDLDKVISITHGKEIYENLKNKTFDPVWFKNVGHNDILYKIENAHYFEVLNHS